MITTTPLRRVGVAAVALAALALAGCANDSDSATSPTPDATTPAATDASPTADAAALDTVTEGVLTIATGEPAYEPWVLDDDPTSGNGFEAAVAYAVAAELGYGPEEVQWVRTTFDSAIAPGAKDWDLNIQQFSITPERQNAVDFSSPYYTTSQAIVTVEGNDAAEASTVAELAGATVGVAVGTTSYTVAAEAFGEDSLQVYNSVGDVVGALNSGQIDAFVTDLPGAFYSAAVEVENGVILGQFAGSEGGDEFGFVLPKDSPNTDAVTAAVDALRTNGTLEALELEWLSDAVDVPVLD